MVVVRSISRIERRRKYDSVERAAGVAYPVNREPYFRTVFWDRIMEDSGTEVPVFNYSSMGASSFQDDSRTNQATVSPSSPL